MTRIHSINEKGKVASEILRKKASTGFPVKSNEKCFLSSKIYEKRKVARQNLMKKAFWTKGRRFFLAKSDFMAQERNYLANNPGTKYVVSATKGI